MTKKTLIRGAITLALFALVLTAATGERVPGIVAGASDDDPDVVETTTPPAGEESGAEGDDGGLSSKLLAVSDLDAGWEGLPQTNTSIESDFCGEKFTPGTEPLETVKAGFTNPSTGEVLAQRLLAYPEGDAERVFNSFNGLKGRCKKWKQSKERNPDGPVRGDRGPERQEQNWDLSELDGFPTIGDETVALKMVSVVPGADEDGNTVENDLETHLVIMRRGDVLNVITYAYPEEATNVAQTEDYSRRADTKFTG